MTGGGRMQHGTRLPAAAELRGGSYGGWIASLLIIVAVLAVGASLWFWFHP
jgi:hypothetical protein